MYTNRLKRLIDQGEVPTGMYMVSNSAMHAEVLAQTGIDYIIVETEHGTLSPLSMEPLATLCRVFKSYDVTPIVRVPANDPIMIQKSLDAGALGVIVPHVRTKEDAVRMVKATRFPPEGFRGCGPLVPANRFVGEFNAYIANSNPEIMVIPLVEEAQAVENFEDISDVEGVSFVMVGPLDLSFSMGLNDYTHPEVLAAQQRVFDICKRKNIPFNIGGGPQQIKEAVTSGARIVVGVGTESGNLYDACKARVDRVRRVLSE